MVYCVTYCVNPVNRKSVFCIENKEHNLQISGDTVTYKALDVAYAGGITEFLQDCIMLDETEALLIKQQIEHWQAQVELACKKNLGD